MIFFKWKYCCASTARAREAKLNDFAELNIKNILYTWSATMFPFPKIALSLHPKLFQDFMVTLSRVGSEISTRPGNELYWTEVWVIIQTKHCNRRSKYWRQTRYLVLSSISNQLKFMRPNLCIVILDLDSAKFTWGAVPVSLDLSGSKLSWSFPASFSSVCVFLSTQCLIVKCFPQNRD